MMGYGTPARRPCHKCTSVPHTSERSVRSNALPGGRSGLSNSRSSIGRCGATMTAALMRELTLVRYPWIVRSGICFLVILLFAFASPARAQNYSQTPRRQFVTVSYDWHYTQPLHFAEHPLEDLLGTEVASTQSDVYEYHTRNEATLIDVV